MGKALTGWTIVFDLDGTLIDTAPDLLSALNHTLDGIGLKPVEMDVIHSIIGHGAKAMLTQAIEHQGRSVEGLDLQQHWQTFVDYYAENIAVSSRFFDDCLASLDALSAQGATLAVCTNKLQSLADQVLRELGQHDRFASIVGADSVPDKKPHGDHILLTVNAARGIPERAIMIGDSRTDEKAARNAGLPFIFVPFGYSAEPASQIASDADAVVTAYSELVSFVLSLVS